ncbi:aminoacyl-histidine dipeptidase [Taylorella equigenitalis]|uniref:aminoacyl-histidine dipeptidase n=1 Tax=Taylorella equigenitalis TaxID=29575 RepID=UPI0003F92135|nr:aminoacyl-histidine dipeptidase [Taylorella equigenitalis]WDU46913.1 aminoacyl-histidine dipeptidase [Taylorella equigenitalis]
MNSNSITELEPKILWKWFDDFCSIPHPSFHEKALSNFIFNKAKEFGLYVEQDEKNNLLIKKPATKGMEGYPAIAMQAHIDMVPQKGVDSNHNFETDPIAPYVREGWVYANDTTLGADNGIGAAMALGVMFSDNVSHPQLDLVLTTEEEIGMGGAEVLNPSWLSAPYLLNLDSEDERVITVACAGGRDITLKLEYEQNDLSADAIVYEVKLHGLKGGHSGIDINKGRVNAIIMLAKILLASDINFALVSLKAGSVRNAIPREASAIVSVEGLSMGDIENKLLSLLPVLSEEFKHTENPFQLSVSSVTSDTGSNSASIAETKRILNLISSIPNGMIKNTHFSHELVETSTSLGVVQISNGKCEMQCLMRSLIDASKYGLEQQFKSIADLAQAHMESSADYPAWQPEMDSPLLSSMVKIFTDYYDEKPSIKAMHAGLECGILKKHAPNMQMISFGPNIRQAHSPKECVEIRSVQECWQLLVNFLANPPGN